MGRAHKGVYARLRGLCETHRGVDGFRKSSTHPTNRAHQGRSIMRYVKRMGGTLAAAVIASVALGTVPSLAQVNPDPNAAPNPYQLDEGWPKLPAGRKCGATFGVS